MHADMDAFFASVEVREKPWLKGKPVAVAGNRTARSVIATASYEARKCGVHSAMPVSKALALCPSLIIIKGNMEKYVSVSRKIIKTLYAYCPAVETVSIDEVFLDLSYTVKNFKEARELGKTIKAEIRKNFGLTVTIGIGPNKLLAKIASKTGKPDGLTAILPKEVSSLLEKLPVEKVSGIGPKMSKLLKEKFGVSTLGELKKIPLLSLYSVFKSCAIFLFNASRGIDNSPVVPDFEREQAKSVRNSVTLAYDTNDPEHQKRVLKYLSWNVAKRLKDKKLYAKTIILTVRFANFRTVTQRKSIFPTNNSKKIYLASVAILTKVTGTKKIRLLGITAANFVRQETLTLFDRDIYDRRDETIDNILKKIQDKYGKRIANYSSIIEITEK